MTTHANCSADPAHPPARWRYGDAWEQYPIRVGEVWRAGTGLVAVHNLFDDPLPRLLRQADTLFIDPPWSLGNLKGFYTKAGRNDYPTDYRQFTRRLFAAIASIAPQTCYIEIGKQHVTEVKMLLHDVGGYRCVESWPVTYYRTHPCWLLKGSQLPHAGRDFTGLDEERCIALIARDEPYTVLGDLCIGRGLVGLHSFRAGRSFVGSELNPRRLAVLLARIAHEGGHVGRLETKKGEHR